MYFLLKMGIFHCYVSLLEGIPLFFLPAEFFPGKNSSMPIGQASGRTLARPEPLLTEVHAL